MDVQAGVPQDSILGPLFFLTYINILLHDLTSDLELFADDTLFPVVTDQNAKVNQIKIDLHNIHR